MQGWKIEVLGWEQSSSKGPARAHATVMTADCGYLSGLESAQTSQCVSMDAGQKRKVGAGYDSNVTGYIGVQANTDDWNDSAWEPPRILSKKPRTVRSQPYVKAAPPNDNTGEAKVPHSNAQVQAKQSPNPKLLSCIKITAWKWSLGARTK